MWNRIFDVDNAVFRAIDTIGKIFILNLYWVICSLPIFTIGASTSALLYASMKLHDREGMSPLISFHPLKKILNRQRKSG